MSHAPSAAKSGLPRDVWRWLQSLELSSYPMNVRRDFSSGYLVADIFSHYYPNDFHLHSYNKGTSLSAKQGNWSRLEKSLQRLNLRLMKEVIEGTIHCKPGAAELLVREVYTTLTNRSIKEAGTPEVDFSDQKYQELLPSLARPTASKAIKNNLRLTELMAEPDISTNQRKAEAIVRRHLENKAAERLLHPGRFKVKPRPNQLEAKKLKPLSRGEGCFDNPSALGTTSVSVTLT